MESIKILAEQKKQLQKRYDELLEKRKSIVETLNQANQDVKLNELTDTVDSIVLSDYRRINYEISEIENLLNHSMVVVNSGNSVIDIGTTFRAKVDYGDEIEEVEYTLVDRLSGLYGNYVSIDSPFGKSVYGKGISEMFKYELPNKKCVTGFIISVNGLIIDDAVSSVQYQIISSQYEQLLEKKKQLMNRGYNPSLSKQIGILNMQLFNCKQLISSYEQNGGKCKVK